MAHFVVVEAGLWSEETPWATNVHDCIQLDKLQENLYDSSYRTWNMVHIQGTQPPVHRLVNPVLAGLMKVYRLQSLHTVEHKDFQYCCALWTFVEYNYGGFNKRKCVGLQWSAAWLDSQWTH